MSLDSNHKTLKDIGGINPKFAKHTMIKNDIVKTFAMQRFGTIDILEQPMCTKCEKPCTWHKGGTAYHVECGTHIKHPITMLEYLRDEIKLSEEQLDALGASMYDTSKIIIDGGLKTGKE